MLPERAPRYRTITKKLNVGSSTDALWRVTGYVPAGLEFDLSEDIEPAMAACRSAEGLADAIGMLTAIGGRGHRTAGFEKAVYVIQVDEDPITKIGVSANPLERVADLQAAHYRELSLFAVIFCPLRQAVAIERGVLRRAEDTGTRLLGEWINADAHKVLRSAFEVARDGPFAVCDGKTWLANMIEKTKAMHRQQREMASVVNRLRVH
jgi:hypothetical protein